MLIEIRNRSYFQHVQFKTYYALRTLVAVHLAYEHKSCVVLSVTRRAVTSGASGADGATVPSVEGATIAAAAAVPGCVQPNERRPHVS